MSHPFPILPAGWSHAHPTGSAYTCSPPVTNTDQDWLIFVNSTLDLHEYASLLTDDGWADCITADADVQKAYRDDPAFGTHWLAYRKGVVNLILTESKSWYLRAIAATELCKGLNLQGKEDRINVFRNVRDNSAEAGSLDTVPLP